MQECHRQKLRKKIGDASVCPAATTDASCACIDRDCQDDPTFKDEKGYFCDTWIGDDCSKASEQWGLTTKGQADIITKCKRSCGYCKWSSPCPYSSASSCTAAMSRPPDFCRACVSDKVSGLDIQGCKPHCSTADGVQSQAYCEDPNAAAAEATGSSTSAGKAPAAALLTLPLITLYLEGALSSISES